jgi:Matrixin
MMRPLVVAVFLSGCAVGVSDEPLQRGRPSTVPVWAEEIDTDVYSLGFDIDPVTGEEVEGVAIVDRLHDGEEEGGSSPADMTAKKSCWKSIVGLGGQTTVEDWGLDATNSSGIADADVQLTIEDSIAEWEVAITSGTDVFGVLDAAFSGIPSTTSDGENNIAFGNAGGGGIIAVTYLWGTAAGITEWDQIYDDTFTWNVDVVAPAGEMDLLNIAVHEVGHSAGLDHPAGIGCAQETMYASANLGETKKRDLNTGDENGINKQYP